MEEQHEWLHKRTDEAHFIFSGVVDTHNCQVNDRRNSKSIFEVLLQQHKVTVWYGFAGDFIICPFFFSEEVTKTGFETDSFTGQRYAALL